MNSVCTRNTSHVHYDDGKKFQMRSMRNESKSFLTKVVEIDISIDLIYSICPIQLLL